MRVHLHIKLRWSWDPCEPHFCLHYFKRDPYWFVFHSFTRFSQPDLSLALTDFSGLLYNFLISLLMVCFSLCRAGFIRSRSLYSPPVYPSAWNSARHARLPVLSTQVSQHLRTDRGWGPGLPLSHVVLPLRPGLEQESILPGLMCSEAPNRTVLCLHCPLVCGCPLAGRKAAPWFGGV